MSINFTTHSAQAFQNTAVSNTAIAVKATAGHVLKVTANNTNAALAFIQVFAVPAASVTVGTTTPIKSIPVPATGGVIDDIPYGLFCSTGISIAATTTATGAVAPGTALLVSVDYV